MYKEMPVRGAKATHSSAVEQLSSQLFSTSKKTNSDMTKEMSAHPSFNSLLKACGCATHRYNKAIIGKI